MTGIRATPSQSISRAAFTLTELLVVIAVVGALVGLLLPAIQAARESGRRTQCLNQLRQLGVAANSYAADRRTFPGGMQQWNVNASVTYRGIPLFVELLPYMEYKSLLVNWHYDNPLLNCTQGPQSNTAPVIPTLVCPSDAIAINPITDTTHGWVYGLTSYGGNGGTRSYFPPLATADGLFHTTGPASEPATNQRPVRPEDITDGLSHTLLFGERSHYDPNYESFNDQGWGDLLDQWGWWGASADRRVIGHLTMSALVPINYLMPFSYDNRAGQTPAADSYAAFAANWNDPRICAFGSCHPGGANFSCADGSGCFLATETDLNTLRALCTRSGGETTP